MAFGLIFFGIGDFSLQMEIHPVYKTKLWFLAGLFSFLIGHIFLMLRLSFRSNELKCPGGEKLNLALVVFIMIVMLSQVLPKIVNDNIMKVAVVLYAFVIGRMLYFSLVLANQEEKFYFSLLCDVAKMSKQQRDGAAGVFVKLMAQTFKGDIMGISYGLKYYVVAATLMTLSDSILAYSRFVDQADRQIYVLTSYFLALVFFALSAMTDQACLYCFTRVVFNDAKLRERLTPNWNPQKEGKRAANNAGKKVDN